MKSFNRKLFAGVFSSLIICISMSSYRSKENSETSVPDLQKKELDKGTEKANSEVKKQITQQVDYEVEKRDIPIVEHPLDRVKTKQRKESQLDMSIEKILKAEKEKSMLIKRDHLIPDDSDDNMESEEKLKEEGENKKLKMFLYQRRKFDMQNDLMIDLHFGFDMEKKVTGEPLAFRPDLGFDKVLINMNQANCTEEVQCSKSDKKKENLGVYDSKDYNFFNAVGFLGVQRIRPGELSQNDENNLDHFFTLPMEFYNNNNNMDKNILGLAPNAVIWKYWSNIYNFPNGKINLTLCYYNHHEYILFDSKIDYDKEIILKVPKDSNIYQFKGKLDFVDSSANTKLENQEVNLCIGNKEGLTMQVTKSIMELVKNSLCNDVENCSSEGDLKNNDMVFSLMFYDFKKEKSFFHAKFFKNSLVEVKDGKLIWKIELLTDKEQEQGCQIILEQEFLKEKYLMISYDLEDPDSLYIGFKIMEDSDFSKFDFYFYSVMLFLILTVAMMILFIILNYKINRFIEKEEKEKEKLLQES